MFGIVNYKMFILVGIILNITPGPNTLYILGRSISQGRKAGIMSVFGISLGAVFHTLFAALGLSVIILKSLLVFNIIKYIGATYLIYMGVKAIIVKREKYDVSNNKEQNIKVKEILISGFLTNVTNPKVTIFFISFLPQFIDLNSQIGAIPFLILGFTFIFTGTMWYIGVVFFSSSFTDVFRKNYKVSNILNKLTGVLFIGLGIKLLTERKN